MEVSLKAADDRGKKRSASIDWLALWILFSAWSSLSGWCLSAMGQLNLMGYGFSFCLFFAALTLTRPPMGLSQGKTSVVGLSLFRSRFLLPKIWLGLALIALMGGILHYPTNDDYLTYRFPRLLYWSWEQKWYWIPTVDSRMNYSGTGFEWLMAPLLIFFKTDRLFFLINFISYLFLPALIFSVFSNLGISKRICWWWMWVFPCGYCYILQAASAGNDSFAAVYGLASLHYIFRARDSSSPFKPLVLSCLAVALLTGAKAANLPLVLPWLITLLCNRSWLLDQVRSWALVPALIVAAAVSFLPMALLNIHFTGDYSGDPSNNTRMKLSNPISGIMGNGLQMINYNLSPPFWPHAASWTLPISPNFHAKLQQDFPRLNLLSGEMQIEEGAGLGLGIILFSAVTLVLGIWTRVAVSGFSVTRNRQAVAILVSGGLALLVYMAKMGSESTARLIAAYYPFLVAGLLVTVALDGRIIRWKLFKAFGILAMLSAFPLVILNPARPLFPVQIIADILAKHHVSENLLARYNRVYDAYSSKGTAFAGLVAKLPKQESLVGLLQSGSELEASLWRPYGTRKIVEVAPEESPQKMKSQGIHYVLVGEDALAAHSHMTINDLTTLWSARRIAEMKLVIRVQRGPENWYVLEL